MDVPDFDRSLNERGRKDAGEMAKRLHERKVHIDVYLSSPAKRAKKTAKYFCKELSGNEDKIILIDRLYPASEPAFYDTIQSLHELYKQVAIFSHNPSITDFANSLCGEVKIANMPTCSIFAVSFKGNWADFRSLEKKFMFFDYPKLIH